MKAIDVPAQTKVFLGVPARQLPDSVRSALGALLYAIPGVEQLHLPQCFALGIMEAPATVLVIVTGPSLKPIRAARRAFRILRRVLRDGPAIDVWPLPFDSPFVQAVEQVGCAIERDPLSLPAYRKPSLWSRLLGAY